MLTYWNVQLLHGLSLWCICHTIQHAIILGTHTAHMTFLTFVNANVLYNYILNDY